MKAQPALDQRAQRIDLGALDACDRGRRSIGRINEEPSGAGPERVTAQAAIEK